MSELVCLNLLLLQKLYKKTHLFLEQLALSAASGATSSGGGGGRGPQWVGRKILTTNTQKDRVFFLPLVSLFVGRAA